MLISFFFLSSLVFLKKEGLILPPPFWGENSCYSITHPLFLSVHVFFVLVLVIDSIGVRVRMPVCSLFPMCLRVRGSCAPRLLGVRVFVLTRLYGLCLPILSFGAQQLNIMTGAWCIVPDMPTHLPSS